MPEVDDRPAGYRSVAETQAIMNSQNASRGRRLAAWLAYHEQHLGDETSEENEKKLLGALIAISSGVEDVEKLGVPADVGRKLLACYDELGDQLN